MIALALLALMACGRPAAAAWQPAPCSGAPDAEMAERRLLSYAAFDTQVDKRGLGDPRLPSSPGQTELLEHLLGELRAMGASAPRRSRGHAVIAEAPGEPGGPRLAFYAHVDVSSDHPADGASPVVHRDFDPWSPTVLTGGMIAMDALRFPELADAAGDTVITGDGTSSLGADDKAGVVAVMALAERLLCSAAPRRATAVFLLVADGEAAATRRRPWVVRDARADALFVVDGGNRGDVRTKTMARVDAVVSARGSPMHSNGPATHGRAYGREHLSAIDVIGGLLGRLAPAGVGLASGLDPVAQCVHVSGSEEAAQAVLVVRSFDEAGIARVLRDAAAPCAPGCSLSTRRVAFALNETLAEPYAAAARRATALAGFAPANTPIRGCTDGSYASGMGVPTVHLFSGWHASHGPCDWASAQEMARVADTLHRLCLEEFVA